MNRSLIACVVIIGVLDGFAAFGATPDEPWDSPPLTAKPEDILRAAAALAPPKDADVDVLLDETSYSFDIQGRRRYVERQVIRFLTQKAVSEWASVESVWTPWCEERPQLRARVISPDGITQELDPKSIGEAPVEQEANVWSDRKILRAPLPAVRPGVIAETVVIVSESKPFFEQGVVRRAVLDRFHPVRKLRLTIDYPSQLPLRYEVHGSNLQPIRTENSDRTRLVFEIRPAKPLKLADIEAFVPPNMPFWTEVSFSTGKSWNDVASGYERLVERQMDLDAVKSLTKEAVGGETNRDLVVAKVLAKVQQVVRYTGLEFGNAAIVPNSPRDTLLHRYGDCKDQATLMTAMLRSAGLPAYVTLIQAGRHTDIAIGLPGLGDFNHAIVCVAGTPAIWVDPTNPYVPAGQLPLSDQGRWALIASSRVFRPAKTPQGDYRQNRNAKTVDCFISDGGGSRIREVLEAAGSCGGSLRSFFASQNEDDLRKGWESYLGMKYHAKTLSRFEHGSPQDLSKPFQVTSETADAKISAADESALIVALPAGSLFSRLPYPLVCDDAGKSEGVSYFGESKYKERTKPLLLPEAHVYELTFHVTPPPGFVLRTLPEDDVQHFGPALLSRHFASTGDVVTAAFRMETGDGLLTAAEANAMHQAIRKLVPKTDTSLWVVPIEFEHRGEKYLRAGQWKQALEEFRRLTQKHTDRPEPYRRYAEALLKAGFGDAARQMARRAIELDPKSSISHWTLANILTYDLLGRSYQPGMDLAAALASYRKAIELDPSNSTTRINYAIALEHDGAGQWYAADADLPGAIEQYQKVRKEHGNLEKWDVNLAVDLFLAKDFAGLDKFIDESPTFSGKGLLIASDVAQHGVEAGEQKAVAITQDADERRLVLVTASDYLNRIRLYPQSLTMLQLAMKDNSVATLRPLAASLSKMRRSEEMQFRDDDPRRVVQEALVATLTGGKFEEQLAGLYGASATSADKTAAIDTARALFHPLTQIGRKSRFPSQRIADAISVFAIDIDSGDTDGWRIDVGTSSAANLKLYWYVVREKQGFRILAPGRNESGLAAEALRQLDDSNIKAAARWLDWASKDKSKPVIPDLFSATPFSRLWMLADHKSPDGIRLAASALLAEGVDPTPAVPYLIQARSKTSSKAEQLQIDRALESAYSQLHRSADLLEIADRLIDGYGARIESSMHKMIALHQLGRRDDLREFLRRQIDVCADKPIEQEYLASLAWNFGAPETGLEVLRSRAKLGTISSIGLNMLAWTLLCQDPVDSQALEDLLAADKRSVAASRLTSQSLAAIDAELGKTSESHENLLRSLDLRTDPPDEFDWYILGRTAEQYGLNDVAVSLYRKMADIKLKDDIRLHPLLPLAAKRSKRLNVEKGLDGVTTARAASEPPVSKTNATAGRSN